MLIVPRLEVDVSPLAARRRLRGSLSTRQQSERSKSVLACVGSIQQPFNLLATRRCDALFGTLGALTE